MEISAEDMFTLACNRLARIVELKQNNVLNEVEYKELRDELLSQVKRSVTPPREAPSAEFMHVFSKSSEHEPVYGYLHAQVVARICKAYKESNQDGKQICLRALAEIANSRALNEGDSIRLEQLMDQVYKPLTHDVANSPVDERAVLDRVTSLGKISYEIVSTPSASATAKAIAGITHQSAIEAGAEVAKVRSTLKQTEINPYNSSNPADIIDSVWKDLVQEDVNGAMNGAAAVITVSEPFLGNLPSKWSLAIVAAVGAVIGGGIQSGNAYGKRMRANH